MPQKIIMKKNHASNVSIYCPSPSTSGGKMVKVRVRLKVIRQTGFFSLSGILELT